MLEYPQDRIVVFEIHAGFAADNPDGLFQLCFALAAGETVFVRPLPVYQPLLESLRAHGLQDDAARISFVNDWGEVLKESRNRSKIITIMSRDDGLSGLAVRWGRETIPIPDRPQGWSEPDYENLLGRRVAVMGAESTGKTTLVHTLAPQLGLLPVPEYVRLYLDHLGRVTTTLADVSTIVCGQVAAETATMLGAKLGVLCDTEPRQSLVWSDILFGTRDPVTEDTIKHRRYDGYILLEANIPWQADPQRCLPEGGPDFTRRLASEISSLGTPIARVSGLGKERLSQAKIELLELLAAKKSYSNLLSQKGSFHFSIEVNKLRGD